MCCCCSLTSRALSPGRHTATRLPQLCRLGCINKLTLFGKSAVALPHGHRLSLHLHRYTPQQRAHGMNGSTF